MAEGLVPLYEAGDLVEAHLLQARLEDAGIEVFIENEATSTAAFPGLQNELGLGPKVLVPEESFEAAQEILDQFLDEAEAGEWEEEVDEEAGDEESEEEGEGDEAPGEEGEGF